MFFTILLAITINGILIALWGYFLHSIFGSTTTWKKIISTSIVSSSILALLPRVALWYQLPIIDYTLASNYNQRSFFFVYSIVFLIIFWGLYWIMYSKPRMTSIVTRLLFAWLFALCILWWLQWLGAGILTRTIIALLEERTKTSTAMSSRDNYRINDSDAIVIWILVALGFSCLENMIYFIQLDSHTTISTISLMLKRSISSRVMHVTYTGIIMLGIQQFIIQKNYKTILTVFISILLWVILHLGYNLFIMHSNMLGMLLLLLFGYFFLSWLIYKSDRVYV